jgi:two-component system cell cycle response regulator DivK
VIEDNEMNLRLVSLILETARHQVLSATDAASGLAVARAEHPDLVLMDVQLPGTDGITATAELKSDPSTAAIPVLAVTALAMKGDRERLLAAGCDGYVAKPYRARELLEAIERTLRPT